MGTSDVLKVLRKIARAVAEYNLRTSKSLRVKCMSEFIRFLCGLHEVYSHNMASSDLFIYLYTRVERLSRVLVPDPGCVISSAPGRAFTFSKDSI